MSDQMKEGPAPSHNDASPPLPNPNNEETSSSEGPATIKIGTFDNEHAIALRIKAQQYLDQGMRLVRLRPSSKKPLSMKAWQNAAPSASEFLEDENIGVQLGPKSRHLVDIDLDIPEARRLAGLQCFFGRLPAFRRMSLPESEPGHRLVICRDAPEAVEAFSFTRGSEQAAIAPLNLPKSVVLELRAGRGFTVFPPSRLGEDQLVFNTGNANVPEMSWQELRRRAGLLAFVALMAAAFPAEGQRDQFAFNLAGALAHLGIEVDAAEEIITAIARQKNDDWQERQGKARSAALKKSAGEPVTGLPELLQLLGLEECDGRLRSWLGQPAIERDDAVPADGIRVGRAEVHLFTDELQDAIMKHMPDRVFRRAGSLVRLSTVEESNEDDGVKRHAGMMEIVPVTAPWLRIETSRAGIQFFKRSRTGMGHVVEPPSDVGLLLSVADETRFPRLQGISMTPTLGCDQPGYERYSGLFLTFPEGLFPTAPMYPSRKQARHALERLMSPLRGFPFIDEAAKSVALSGMISAVIRGELRTCPLHGFDAPTKGTGKGKIADIIGIMGTGTKPSGITYSGDVEENEKRLVSILRAGDPVVLIDNVTADVEGDFLCTMLTNEVVQARILGHSERVRLSTRVLMLATGNNLRLSGDMTRRAVVCRLDAKMINPEERRFDFDAVEEVLENRPQLVMDALTVVRGYIADAQPHTHRAYGNFGNVNTLEPFGSFEDWDLVRGALVWLGRADPADTRASVKQDNPQIEEKAQLFKVLLENIGVNKRFTVAEVTADSKGEKLRSAMGHLLRHGEWQRYEAGHLLRRHKDVPFMGATIRSRPNRLGVQEWWVEGQPDSELLPPF